MKMVCIGEESLIIAPDDEMKIKYYILEENKKYSELNLETKTYGIKIETYRDVNDINIYTEDEIKDITIDRKQIVNLSHTLKKNQVLPEHLKDVIEDFIWRGKKGFKKPFFLALAYFRKNSYNTLGIICNKITFKIKGEGNGWLFSNSWVPC